MKVTSIRIFPIQGNPLVVALADIVLDAGLALSELRIVRTQGDKLCVLYPVSQHSSASAVRHICNPINRETQTAIEQAILTEYRKISEKERKI